MPITVSIIEDDSGTRHSLAALLGESAELQCLSAYAWGSPMSMRIARKVVEHFHRIRQPKSEMEKLSKRELEVLTLLAKGLHYKEIGDKLEISLGSVRTYL